MRDLHNPPGNARVAVALLEVLGSAGDSVRRARVERALGDDGAVRRRRTDWIRRDLLREIFRDVGVDPPLARRVGRALVAPRGVGLLLCYAGIATPEKAYRRADQLLARERQGDRFVPGEIHEESARVEFHPKEPAPEDAIFCAMRHGMFEAMPTLYGLLPARVRETQCAHRGASHCSFEVEWRSVPRTWLVTGVLAGVAFGAALGGALGAGPLGPLGWAIAAGFAAGVLGGAAGRSIDLARQLAAVAGGRRGQLALLDQMDGVLAEKMDALAKLDQTSQERQRGGGADIVRARTEPRGDADDEDAPVAPDLLHRFNDSVATLQTALARLRGPDADVAGEIELCDQASRGLRAVGVELSEGAEAAGDEGRMADLVDIVRHAIAAVAPSQPGALKIALEIETGRAPIRCHPFQLEQVVIQLLSNAAESLHGEGRVEVVVRASPEGFELAVSDGGDGIDPEVLDRLFDPFFAPNAGSADSGLGLPFCYRTVDRHGGELSVQSEPEGGTTVTVMLPAEWDEAPG
jgi:signal transduction histidine kinase